jgi:IS5 family transposase
MPDILAPTRVAFINAHPIQYFVPLYADLNRTPLNTAGNLRSNGRLGLGDEGDGRWRGNRDFRRGEWLKALSVAGDPLERLLRVTDFEVFRVDLEAALSRSDRAKGGRPPYDAVLMFKVLVLQTLCTLSDDQTEYQLKRPAVFHAVCRTHIARRRTGRQNDLVVSRPVARAGAAERLFARFDALPRAKGWLAVGGQIIDATVIEARRPRLTQTEKDTIKGGGFPAEWTPARRA